VKRKFARRANLPQGDGQSVASAPSKPVAARPNAALPIKAIKALAYRVKGSRIVSALLRRKSAAYRSLEKFAAAAEIGKGIASANYCGHGPRRQVFNFLALYHRHHPRPRS
jgi:hypothetical protein